MTSTEYSPLMTSQRKARIVRYAILGLLAVALLFALYQYAQPHVEVVDLNVEFNSKHGYSENFREQYFSRAFPNEEEIENYWKNSTLVIADPKFGNKVLYFDNDHHFVSWLSGFGGVLYTYDWSLSPERQMLKLGSRSRSVVIQKFCIRSIENPESTREDNCRLVPETSGLYNRGASEHRKGDLFGLLGQKHPPFPLPRKEPINFEALLAQLPKR